MVSICQCNYAVLELSVLMLSAAPHPSLASGKTTTNTFLWETLVYILDYKHI